MQLPLRAIPLLALTLALSSIAAGPDPSDLNAKLKSCAYSYTPTGDPCIDKDQRDIWIDGDRILFRERHDYTPYSGGPACRNYAVEREDQAAVADLVPEVVIDSRRKVLWLTLGCNSGKSCVSNVKALRSGKPIENPSPGPTQTKITTALQCKDAAAIAADLKGFIAASQSK